MNAFEKSKWIWLQAEARPDEYAEFYEEVDFYGKKAELYLSSDSNYTVYVNGTLAAFGQYADFPNNKVYDCVDLSRYMRQGKNVVAFRIWYYGIDTASTYYPGAAGLIYALYCDGALSCYSSAKTPSRPSPTFTSHKCKEITMQLGLSFEYDSKCADAWMFGQASEKYPFAKSRELDIAPKMRPRTCLPTEFGETHRGREISGNGIAPQSKCGRIFDLGREEVGFICVKFRTDSDAPVTVAFGEHIADGHVRCKVGGRDFSFIYHPTRGEINYYMNAFRRFGCRYIELISDEMIFDVEVSLRSVVYPAKRLPYPENLTLAQEKIYDACVFTLECCMHEHYEDCPWREQALYTMDSRNQMLAGYYAFGEYLFPKANLELIAEDDRPDGLLSICYPVKRDFAIPSFSLHFITECEEYLRYSADEDFIRRIYPKIEKTLSTFLSRIDGTGLIRPFEGKNMWNFYEWEVGLDGALYGGIPTDVVQYDVVINALLSYAISRMISINERLGFDTDTLYKTKTAINQAINEHFYNAEAGLYETTEGNGHFAKLTNALAILSGAASDDKAAAIAERLVGDESLVDASLSMRAFLYDALISVDRDKYAPFVLSDIERIYTPMLKTGNNTVWETELGEADFAGAGSLCHGWSAIPIYYFNELK